MQFATAPNGWVEVVDSDRELGLPGRLYLRLSSVEGFPRVTELYVDGSGEPIQPGALRRVPLARLEQSAAEEFDARILVDTVGPDLSRLAQHFATTYGPGAYDGDHCSDCGGPVRKHPDAEGRPRALTDWVALSMLAQRRDVPGVPQVPEPKRKGGEPVTLPELQPPAAGLSDEFLSDVARAYDAAVALGKPPAITLAEMTGVSVKTVNAWCLKARRRGVMRPARRSGRVV